MENKFGYKVCYQQFSKNKLKLYLVCNTYDGAVWSLRYYETHDTYDRKSKQLLKNVKWYVIPVRNYFEYKWLWKGCPF